MQVISTYGTLWLGGEKGEGGAGGSTDHGLNKRNHCISGRSGGFSCL